MKKNIVFRRSGAWRKVMYLLCVLYVYTLTAFAQQRVSGTVTDAAGEPVIGANIMEKGVTANGTVTDVDGKFTLSVKSGATLTVSFIGYVTQEIGIGNRSELRITLVEDSRLLDEVVVVGYGTVQRKYFTGSVSTIKVADSPVALQPRTNAFDMLRGTVTGVTVGREADAGGTPGMQIHGQKSVSGSSNPLVVVDGMIYPEAWQNIDPLTIESMSVLKDASSLAAYGSQAANGVVMITTKKGKLGKPVVAFNTSVTFSEHTGIPKYQSAEDYIASRNIAYNTTDPKSWLKVHVIDNYEAGIVTDWIDYVTRTGVLQNYSASVSGATEKLNYYLSLSHNDQKGIVYGDDYMREALTLKLQSDITNWFQVGAQTHYTYHNMDGVRATLSPWFSPFGHTTRPNGKQERYTMGDSGLAYNPLWETDKGGVRDNYQRQSVFETSGHVLLKAPWIPGLSYRFNAFYSNRINRTNEFRHEGYYVLEGRYDDDTRYAPETIRAFLSSANGSNSLDLQDTYVLDNILNYTASFGKHFIDVSAVYTRDYKQIDRHSLNGSNYASVGNTLLGYNGLAYATTQTVGLAKTLKTNIAYLGRINYTYNERYNLTASVRRDGSSVFGANKKWGVFPAGGLAWIASKEHFMKNVEPVNFLKLKASWGKNGNQSIDPYGTLSTINTGQNGAHPYYFNNGTEPSWGQFVTAIGNPNLGWEETSSWNAGVEIGLLKDRVNFELNVYKSQTTNQVFNRTIPVMGNGFTSTKATMGRVDNQGVEFTLNTVNLQTGEFEWLSMLNFYLNRNKLVELYGDGKDDIGSSLFLGKSLGAIYGLKPIGVVQEEDTEYMAANARVPGDPKFADLNGDGKITVSGTDSDDRTILGYNKENFRMNMSHTLRYKNWELFALFTGVFGGGSYGMSVNAGAYTTASYQEVWAVTWDHPWWTSENKSNTYLRPNANVSNYMPVLNWTFVRLQDLNLSYTFRQQALRSAGIQNLRAYLAGKNLFTLTQWLGGDPEDHQGFGNATNPVYPVQRSVSIGLNLSF